MCPNETHHLTLNFKNYYVIFPSPANFEKKKNFLINEMGEKGLKLKAILNIVLTKIITF